MSFPPQHQDSQPGLEYLMHPRPISLSSSYMPAAKLKGKVAVVTGGDSGIGRAVCYHFALEGATVAFVYVSPKEDVDADETLDKLRKYKPPLAGEPMKIPVTDLGYHENYKKVVDEVVKAYGRIDILVNNAAEQQFCGDIEDMDPNQVERVFRTNIFSYFFMAMLVLFCEVQLLCEAHEGGRQHNKLPVKASVRWEPHVRGLRIHKGCHSHLHQRTRSSAGQARHTREWRCSGADMDSAECIDVGGGEDRASGGGYTAGESGAAL